jgi:hypothetical protein
MAQNHSSKVADDAGTLARVRARMELWQRLLERANAAHPTV